MYMVEIIIMCCGYYVYGKQRIRKNIESQIEQIFTPKAMRETRKRNYYEHRRHAFQVLMTLLN